MSLSGIEKYSQFVDIIDATNVIRVEMNSDDDSYESVSYTHLTLPTKA